MLWSFAKSEAMLYRAFSILLTPTLILARNANMDKANVMTARCRAHCLSKVRTTGYFIFLVLNTGSFCNVSDNHCDSLSASQYPIVKDSRFKDRKEPPKLFAGALNFPFTLASCQQ